MRDMFISYNHHDRAWAEKLHQSLQALGYDVFLDHANLRAGGRWHDALNNELAESKSLVILWSKTGIESNWVHNEVAQFQQRRDHGPVVQVALNASFEPLAALHLITDIHAANQYVRGPGNIDANIWARVIERVEDGAGDKNLLPVHKVIIASTKPAMKAILQKKGGSLAAKALIAKLALGANLHDRYGHTPEEWQPFGQARTIDTVLANLRQTLIEGEGPRFTWKPSTALWSPNRASREKYVDRLLDEPCVVVIDALSMYDMNVREVAGEVIDMCLANPAAAVMLLPPTIDSHREPLRGALEAMVSGLFKKVYREFRESRLPKAHCSLLTPDDLEIARLLTNVIRSSEKPAVLRMA
jgi:hypothetical protein